MGRRVKNFVVDWAQATPPTKEAIVERLDYLSPKEVNNLYIFLDELVPYLRSFAAHDAENKRSEFPNSLVQAKCEKSIKALESVADFFRDFDLKLKYRQSPGSEWAYSPTSRKILERAAVGRLGPLLSSDWVFSSVGVRIDQSLEQDRVMQLAASAVEKNPRLYSLKLLEQLRLLVEDFKNGFSAAAPRGGPRRRTIEPNVITNLASIYSKLGREPTSNPDGDFHAFAESIVELLGCEAGWIPSHLSAGVRKWRQNRT